MERKKSQVDNYCKQKSNKQAVTIVLLLALGVTMGISMLVGQYGISPLKCIRILLGVESADTTTLTMIRNILLHIRLPRTLAALLIGGALATAGLTYQCVFRNMLVSQDVLGVSTGACVGAAFAIVMDMSVHWIQGMAFGVGIFSVLLVFALAKMIKMDKTLSLILAGILISGLMSSVLGYIKYTANPETHLQNIIYWIMGDLSSVSMTQLGQIAIPLIICVLLIFFNRWKLNVFSFIDSEAISLGFNINVYRIMFIVASTTLVSLAVSIAGAIGWIGLVIPQLVRCVIGTDNTDTIGLSFIMGAEFLLLMDILNRLISKAELPISILTGIVGTPIFVICLFLKQKGENHGKYADGQ